MVGRRTTGVGAIALLFVLGGCSHSGSVSHTESGVLSVPPVDGVQFSKDENSRYSSVVGTKGMVVAEDGVAAAWGAEILRRGGNAIDAAVATGFALSVTMPNAGSLGGGGFMVYCPKPTAKGPSECHVLDYRETAPAKATRDMYIKEGKPRTDLSQVGALAPGVPGVTAGLLTALQKFGTKSRQSLLTRPIQLARQGSRFNGTLESAALEDWKNFNPAARKALTCDSKAEKPCAPGQLIRQPDLAKVLGEISNKGAAGFYQGWVAERISSEVQKAGGILSLQDLRNYRPEFRKPVVGDYRGMEVVSMPPPSAGGTSILMMLRYAEKADQAGAFADGWGSAKMIQGVVHGMQLAFADRAYFFGDPGFWNVPVSEMLSTENLDRRWNDTFRSKKTNYPTGPQGFQLTEKQHTTHFSVIDHEGNAVAVTTTINGNYGSGFVPEGTGVFLNNEMDDFSIQPGTPNMFGLVGSEANSVKAGKRPLSSMSPTIVRDAQGNNRVVIGGAGGPRITTAVYLSLLARLRFGMTLTDAVASPRFHHQWKPDVISMERYGFSREIQDAVKAMGYTLKENSHSGRVHALERFPNGRVWGVPDFRGDGVAVAE